MKQTRRGFFGLVGKLAAVGTAIGVAPSLLKPLQNIIKLQPGTYTLAAWVTVKPDRMYVDGVEVPNTNPVQIPLDGKHHHVLAVKREKPSTMFDGKVAEVRHYNRPLTLREIQSAWGE